MTISMLLLPAGAVSISLGWTVTAHFVMHTTSQPGVAVCYDTSKPISTNVIH